MPIYEYECQVCGHRFEKLQKVADITVMVCEKCTGVAKRVISKVAFRLQGGGWYETDFKSNKDHKKNLADTSNGSKNENTAPASPAPTTKTETNTKQE